jgi:hypothetical protein
MTPQQFYILFGATWVCAFAYGLAAFRLLYRIRGLKQAGAAADAPDPLSNPLDIGSYLVWLITGRYGEVRDDVVRRWAAIARVLFVAALPLMLAVFAVAFTTPGLLD